jgi:hypothetical protein
MERSEYRSLAISVVALLIFFALTLQAVLSKSPTADEGMHLLRSQVLRQTDELELQGQHAPLSHWLIGTFLFSEPTMPPVSDLPSWPRLSPEDLVQEFLWLGQVYVGRLLFLGTYWPQRLWPRPIWWPRPPTLARSSASGTTGDGRRSLAGYWLV